MSIINLIDYKNNLLTILIFVVTSLCTCYFCTDIIKSNMQEKIKYEYRCLQKGLIVSVLYVCNMYKCIVCVCVCICVYMYAYDHTTLSM